MFTSYFGNISKIENPVSISSRNPEWFSGNWYKKLAPNGKLIGAYIRGEIGKKEYIPIYNEQLNKLDPREIYLEIIDLFGENATLCCYEPPNKFCHRHLVAKWLHDSIGVKIKELC